MEPKLITLSAKEIARADGDLTTVVRPQARGGYLVGLVRVSTRRPVFRMSKVDTKAEIGEALASDLRMAAKCAFPGNMCRASRKRAYGSKAS